MTDKHDDNHVHEDKKTTNGHAHRHVHEGDLHQHEHVHGGVKHEHAHVHEPLVHEHIHGHPWPGHEHVHDLDRSHLPEHAHLHAYSFERYSEIVSFFHQLDSRVKLISILVLIVTIVLTPPLPMAAFAVYAVIIFALMSLSRLPWSFVLKRSLVIIPFVLFVVMFAPFMKNSTSFGSYDLGIIKLQVFGLVVAWNALIKAWLSVMLLIILTTSTRFSELLQALTWMKMPPIIVAMISFIYRFAFNFAYHLGNMYQALKARGFGGTKAWQWRVLSQLLAGLFIRAFERGERLYDAMLSRGFDGSMPFSGLGRLGRNDIIYVCLFFSVWVGTIAWRLA